MSYHRDEDKIKKYNFVSAVGLIKIKLARPISPEEFIKESQNSNRVSNKGVEYSRNALLLLSYGMLVQP